MNTKLAENSRSPGTGKVEAGRYDITSGMERAARDPQWPCCPCCQNPLFRIRRRFVDLAISLFVQVRRYRCRSLNCGWEGNLRVKRPAPQGESRAERHEGETGFSKPRD
jgi:hypothetical protein